MLKVSEVLLLLLTIRVATAALESNKEPERSAAVRRSIPISTSLKPFSQNTKDTDATQLLETRYIGNTSSGRNNLKVFPKSYVGSWKNYTKSAEKGPFAKSLDKFSSHVKSKGIKFLKTASGTSFKFRTNESSRPDFLECIEMFPKLYREFAPLFYDMVLPTPRKQRYFKPYSKPYQKMFLVKFTLEPALYKANLANLKPIHSKTSSRKITSMMGQVPFPKGPVKFLAKKHVDSRLREEILREGIAFDLVEVRYDLYPPPQIFPVTFYPNDTAERLSHLLPNYEREQEWNPPLGANDSGPIFLLKIVNISGKFWGPKLTREIPYRTNKQLIVWRKLENLSFLKTYLERIRELLRQRNGNLCKLVSPKFENLSAFSLHDQQKKEKLVNVLQWTKILLRPSVERDSQFRPTNTIREDLKCSTNEERWPKTDEKTLVDNNETSRNSLRSENVTRVTGTIPSLLRLKRDSRRFFMKKLRSPLSQRVTNRKPFFQVFGMSRKQPSAFFIHKSSARPSPVYLRSRSSLLNGAKSHLTTSKRRSRKKRHLDVNPIFRTAFGDNGKSTTLSQRFFEGSRKGDKDSHLHRRVSCCVGSTSERKHEANKVFGQYVYLQNHQYTSEQARRQIATTSKSHFQISNDFKLARFKESKSRLLYSNVTAAEASKYNLPHVRKHKMFVALQKAIRQIQFIKFQIPGINKRVHFQYNHQGNILKENMSRKNRFRSFFLRKNRMENRSKIPSYFASTKWDASKDSKRPNGTFSFEPTNKYIPVSRKPFRTYIKPIILLSNNYGVYSKFHANATPIHGTAFPYSEKSDAKNLGFLYLRPRGQYHPPVYNTVEPNRVSSSKNTQNLQNKIAAQHFLRPNIFGTSVVKLQRPSAFKLVHFGNGEALKPSIDLASYYMVKDLIKSSHFEKNLKGLEHVTEYQKSMSPLYGPKKGGKGPPVFNTMDPKYARLLLPNVTKNYQFFPTKNLPRLKHVIIFKAQNYLPKPYLLDKFGFVSEKPTSLFSNVSYNALKNQSSSRVEATDPIPVKTQIATFLPILRKSHKFVQASHSSQTAFKPLKKTVKNLVVTTLKKPTLITTLKTPFSQEKKPFNDSVLPKVNLSKDFVSYINKRPSTEDTKHESHNFVVPLIKNATSFRKSALLPQTIINTKFKSLSRQGKLTNSKKFTNMQNLSSVSNEDESTDKTFLSNKHESQFHLENSDGLLVENVNSIKHQTLLPIVEKNVSFVDIRKAKLLSNVSKVHEFSESSSLASIFKHLKQNKKTIKNLVVSTLKNQTVIATTLKPFSSQELLKSIKGEWSNSRLLPKVNVTIGFVPHSGKRPIDVDSKHKSQFSTDNWNTSLPKSVTSFKKPHKNLVVSILRNRTLLPEPITHKSHFSAEVPRTNVTHTIQITNSENSKNVFQNSQMTFNGNESDGNGKILFDYLLVPKINLPKDFLLDTSKSPIETKHESQFLIKNLVTSTLKNQTVLPQENYHRFRPSIGQTNVPIKSDFRNSSLISDQRIFHSNRSLPKINLTKHFMAQTVPNPLEEITKLKPELFSFNNTFKLFSNSSVTTKYQNLTSLITKPSQKQTLVQNSKGYRKITNDNTSNKTSRVVAGEPVVANAFYVKTSGNHTSGSRSKNIVVSWLRNESFILNRNRSDFVLNEKTKNSIDVNDNNSVVNNSSRYFLSKSEIINNSSNVTVNTKFDKLSSIGGHPSSVPSTVTENVTKKPGNYRIVTKIIKRPIVKSSMKNASFAFLSKESNNNYSDISIKKDHLNTSDSETVTPTIITQPIKRVVPSIKRKVIYVENNNRSDIPIEEVIVDVTSDDNDTEDVYNKFVDVSPVPS